MKFLLIAYVLISSAVQANADIKKLSIEKLINSMHLGVAYKTGNMYLTNFQQDSMRSESKALIPVASVLKYIFPHSKKMKILTSSLEKNCIENEKEPLREMYTFYYFMEKKNCNGKLIGRYKHKLNLLIDGPMVFGVSNELPIENIKYLSKKIRPVTKSETLSIAVKKIANDKNNKKWGCTGQPSYIDSAKEAVSFSISESPFSVKISNYSDPGCSGHLTDIYILDIFKMKKLTRTFIHYRHIGNL
jgi:hypothetical protein